MSDPVADFLAREQDALAELEGSAPTSDPDVSGEDTPSLNGVPDLDGGVAGLAIGGRDSGVDLEALGGGSNFNDDFASAPPLTNGSSSTGPSPVPTIPRIEPETIRIWRENQKIVLEKKDADEEKKKEEWKKAAKKELDDWYAQRTAQLNSTKNANRKAEDEAAADRAKGSGQGAEWEQIARLCEAPKGSKNTKDTSRLKSLLLHLKNVKKQ